MRTHAQTNYTMTPEDIFISFISLNRLFSVEERMRLLRKTVSGIMLALLLIGMLTLAFNIQPVKAEPKTWIVDDNGPADFSKIQDAVNAANPKDIIYVKNGTYYENVGLNKTVSLVGENNETAIIDANGTSNAIYVTAHLVTIKGFTVRNASTGIFLDGSAGNIISDNIITSNGQGLSIQYSSSNNIAGNTFLNNYIGISMYQCVSNILRNNNLTGNTQYNLYIRGDSLGYYIHDIDSSNIVNGKPIYYWVNQKNSQIPSNAGYVALINSTNITIRSLNLTHWRYEGLLLAYTTNSTVESVDFSTIHLLYSNYNLINNSTVRLQMQLEHSFSNRIINIKIYNSSMGQIHGAGIFELRDSCGNSIVGNQISAPVRPQYSIGIALWDSHRNIIADNDIENQGNGIYFSSSIQNIVINNTFRHAGIWGSNSNNNNLFKTNTCIDSSLGLPGSGNAFINNSVTQCEGGGIACYEDGTVISGNLITNNTIGIWIGGYVTNCYITGNVIANNTYGIYANTYNTGNRIYHNNFIDNVNDIQGVRENIWDNGFGEGNFWSDYVGEDLDKDGIGDTLVPHIGVDWYPLIAPISIFDVGSWKDKPCEVYVISNSTVSNFQLAVTKKILSFDVVGNIGSGFCRVTIPNIVVEDLWQGNYMVLVDGEPPLMINNWTDNSNTYIYFTYQHSEHKVLITSSTPPIVNIFHPSEMSPIYAHPGTNVAITYTYTENNPTNAILQVYNATHTIGIAVLTDLEGGTNVERTDMIYLETWTLEGLFNLNATVYSVSGLAGTNMETNAVIVDLTSPYGAILINEDATFANSSSVTLTLSAFDTASGVAKMRFSNDNITWTSWETYNTSKSWTLTSGDGSKIAYVQFIDNAGLTSNVSEDSITLDMTSPMIGIPSQKPEDDVQPDQEVRVLVNVTDSLSGIKNVTLSYNLNDSTIWIDSTMTLNSTTGLYETAIQVQQAHTLVRYEITAYDNAGNHMVEDNSGQYYVYTVIPEFTSTIILPLFMLTTLIATILLKKKRKTKL